MYSLAIYRPGAVPTWAKDGKSKDLELEAEPEQAGERKVVKAQVVAAK